MNQDIPEHPAAKQGVIGKHAPMDIAIIGLSGRFPGADNVDTFWENLRNGVNSIQKVPPKRWNADEYYSPIVAEPDKSYCRMVGFYPMWKNLIQCSFIYLRLKQNRWILSKEYSLRNVGKHSRMQVIRIKN